MLTMKEKVFIATVIVFVALVAATVVVSPVGSFQVQLVTSPEGNSIYHPAGDPFNITCRVLGGADSKISTLRWINKDGNVIPEGIPGVRKDGKNGIRLEFTSPKIEESGTYKCEAAFFSNPHVLEKATKITFHGQRPTFEVDFESLTAEKGSKVELKCSAVGDMPITYEWYQNEDKVSEDSNSSIFVQNSEGQSALVIREVAKSHGGMYTCMAKNDHGLTSKPYELKVVSSGGNETDNGTPSIKKVEVRNITVNSVEFLIFVSGSAKFIEVRYKDTRLRNDEYRMQWNYGGNYEVKDLNPGGEYSFRFKAIPATPSKNKTSWSDEYVVTLLPLKPEMILENVVDGTVRFSWFINSGNSLPTTIDFYELKYFSVHRDWNTWSSGTCVTTIQIPSCKGSSYAIAGLSQNVYYELQLRAHTAAGYGESHKQKIFLRK